MEANSREVVEYILFITCTVELIANEKANVIYVPRDKIPLVMKSHRRRISTEKRRSSLLLGGQN